MLSEITEIVGENNVSASLDDRLCYSSDATGIEGNTKLVVWPGSEVEVRRIVELANSEDFSILARGGGTCLTGGAVPSNGIVMDLSRMDRIVEIGEDSVVAESGIILGDLNSELKKNDVQFPIKPGSYRVCTLGGCIATNAAGMRAVRYGKTKDWVLALEVVTGKGELGWFQGDAEVFCGSEGILGIVTKARIKITKPIGKTSLSLFILHDYSELVEKIDELKDEVIALEFIDEMTSELIGLGKGMHLLAEFEGNRGEIKDEREIENIWAMRDGAYPSLAKVGYPLISDPQLPVEKLPILLSELNRIGIPCFGHVAIGIVHAHFPAGRFKDMEKLFELTVKLGGEISGEHGIGTMKKKFLDANTKERFKKLKEKFDPNGILNPGKVI